MLRALASLRLFFILCLLLAAAFLYQTIFNKGAAIYGTPWFSALGLALAANISACSLRKLKTGSAHFLLLHSGLVIIILGAFATRLYRFEAQLPLHTGTRTSLAYKNDVAYKLPFSIGLDSFRIEYHAEPSGKITLREKGLEQVLDAREGAVFRTAGGAEIKVLRAVRDFGLTAGNEVIEKSPYWNNPAVRLEIRHGGKTEKLWFFSNFPGMHGKELPLGVSYALEHAEIKDYRSAVTLTSSEGPELKAEIGVNKPLKFGAYTLYQTNYDPADAGYTLLTVTMDRGVWAVYCGFALLLTGILLWLRK